MDVEIGRLMERLEELGLAEDTLIAFISDHGEEFLEHGRRFHGYHTYGEMLNVPLALWWPGGIPAGVDVPQTVQSIDLMPTLLELSGLETPERVQGQSLVPLLATATPSSLGWRPRPAFAERAFATAAFEDVDDRRLESLVVVHEGWKLIHNTSGPDGWPEYELYDHTADPLNLEDVADENPERVEQLARLLDGWHESALAARVETEEAAEDLSDDEIRKLRSLGYLQ
jgi:arylsulfatase A-like enzyme